MGVRAGVGSFNLISIASQFLRFLRQGFFFVVVGVVGVVVVVVGIIARSVKSPRSNVRIGLTQ